jgi:rSAM/selenodomain-associated transferase 1
MVDAADAPVVALLTRAPSSGGKTRLFASLGRPPDPALRTALLLDTLDGSAAPGVRRVIAVTPPEGCDEVRRLAGGVEVMPQPVGHLGDRMRGIMASLFEQGAPAVALIGSDIPHIAPGTIAEAFTALTRHPDVLVLGPAADGGYYLIASQRLPDVFTGVEWGSSHVRQQTARAAEQCGLTVHYLSTMADVDNADDLRRACATGRAPRTAAWLAGVSW